MKRLLCFFLMLLGSISVFAQLERGSWQLQNPPLETLNSVIEFDDGRFANSISYSDNQFPARRAIGSYRLSGNLLVIVTEGQRYSYNVIWYSKNKFALQNDIVTLIYSQSGSADDEYLSTQQSSPTKTEHIITVTRHALCYTCKGTGRCKICSGMKSYSNPYTGDRIVCKACSGTGKCWHCSGSGYQ